MTIAEAVLTKLRRFVITPNDPRSGQDVEVTLTGNTNDGIFFRAQKASPVARDNDILNQLVSGLDRSFSC